MSHYDVPARDDRREDPRVRLEMFLNEYVKERPFRALAVNVSLTGLYVQKLAEPVVRYSRTVGLEFELPGTNEVIWARAESRFDSIEDDFHLTGLRFVAMATKHERLVRDYVREREWLLERMLLRIRYGPLKRPTRRN
jgi:c-di-GMP-binding flagellar brake protein YcgR